MFYIALWLVLGTVWGGALLLLPLLQDREMKGKKAAKPQQEAATRPAHATA
ncbi:MAG: hypothetical protein H6993_19335 [Pseudomonadales bacterium]|nr:hypothetical protein [Planctomycetota bacterium]MCP5186129.1 hypothetical protein [Pseudomonadales bacterium]